MSRKALLGAAVEGNGVRFTLWAPRPKTVTLVIRDGAGDRHVAATDDGDGYRTTYVPDVAPGARYGYIVDGQGPFPDPCSRSQPEGPHGLSEVVDPGAFEWTDAGWRRPRFADLAIYECHIGTFTPEGTFDAATGHLERLRDLGVTAIEVMPVASFPGRWGWGYDGVALFAPFHAYGGPEALRRFVDAAHTAGLAVILDVVYNHFGPDGNYTGAYSADYVSPRHHTPWGDAINFDGPGSEHVREFYRQNLHHWLAEYHIDGFRFDATHAIVDDSPTHILAELGELAGAFHGARPGAPPYLTAESNENDARYVRPRDEGGFGFDAVWADDFHHCVRTLLLGEREGYLRGYQGTVEELGLTIEQGFLYEGQYDPGSGVPRGAPARDVPWSSFIYCIQNHDQTGNQPFGERLNVTASLDHFRAATVLLLLLPQVPMLFQGREWFAPTPFLYFSDHHEELGRLVTEGRRREFAAFRAFNHPETRELIPDPQAESTFRASVLRPPPATGIVELAAAFHRELLSLRHTDPVLRDFRLERLELDVTVRGDCLLVALLSRSGRRWIVANFGKEQHLELPEAHAILFDSTDGRFGGRGKPVSLRNGVLNLPGGGAVFLGDDQGMGDRNTTTDRSRT